MFSPFPFFIFTLYIFSAKGDDSVLGCNGFVKSEIDINYSKVEVKLFTKQGSLKDHTECAPNNGYYFLPLYDKGEYILRVSPPEGWRFEPEEVSLSVDGVNDPCSQGKDINFVFKGFAITGQVVTEGHNIGPAKVLLSLNHENSTVTRVESSEKGHFIFSPVAPGDYIVEATHPTWKVTKGQVKVSISQANGVIPAGALTVAGYDVSGSVTSDDEPISGVSFLLYSKSEKASKPEGCKLLSPPGFGGIEESGQYLCYVVSNDNGEFTFPQLPPGDYVLVPFYATEAKSTKFDVHPKKLAFAVGHASLQLQTPFQVRGFTVSGKVRWSEGGAPLKGATIYLNSRLVGKTDSDGIYHLESMKAGTYTILVKAEGVEFSPKDIKVTATTLPDIFPEKFKVCGKLSPPMAGLKIIVSPSDQEVVTDDKGSYCIFLPKGTFSLSVKLKEDAGDLQFSPAKRLVNVVDKILTEVNFSQLQCTVQGKITCMTVCPLISVNLKPRGSRVTIVSIARNGVYEFNKVTPGDYDIYIEPGLGWCWAKETQPLNVNSELVEGPTFTQSGYIVTIVSSHETKVVYYKAEGGGKDKNEISVSKGNTYVCVPTSGPYIFEPVGCHGYKERLVRWVSGPVTLSAITHKNTILIQTPQTVEDLVVRATPTGEGASAYELKPTFLKKTPEGAVYEMNLQLRPGESLNLEPKASLLLFTPTSNEIVGGDDCHSSTEPIFTAERGHVLSGRVTTAEKAGLKEVTVSIVDPQGSVIVEQLTGEDGSYKFPPIRMASSYKVTAEKEGFVISPSSQKLGDFNAHKLAEIIVTVVGKEDGEPLQGVLLSLSGGESYRRNAQTNSNGTMTFLSLSPGEYFLRPMMKEYRFSPPSKMIEVKEGATFQVTLSGRRVAFSGMGVVSSLNGEPESGVVVEAVGVGNCSLLQEDATSGPNGHFRIRGLQPYCEYNIKVKEGHDVNQQIQSSIPLLIPIKVENSDVDSLKLVALRPPVRTDITVLVVPDHPEDLKTLRVKLSREDSPDSAIYIAKLSDFKATPSFSLRSALITLPSVPVDGESYIIKLESALSQVTHSYTLRPIHFKADSPIKVFKLTFSPRSKASEPDLPQPSYSLLPLLLIVAVCAYYREKIVFWAIHLYNLQRKISVPGAPRQSTEDSDQEPYFLKGNKKKTLNRK